MNLHDHGSAHGRFQPFHRGHLEYVTAALGRCRHLWLGITQFAVDRLKSSPEDRHRESRFHNPLSYFERVALIQRVLDEAEVPRTAYTITPFPVDEPKLLSDFLDPGIKIYTTIYDNWNRYKVQTLRSYGYDVEVLWERKEKTYSGIRIRESMLQGDSFWRTQLTPAAVAELERLELPARLVRLANAETLGERGV